MRVLIDIGHPAHVHLFKNAAWKLIENGHEVLFTVREKEHETYLLRKYGLNFKSIGKHYNSLSGKLIGLITFNIRLLRLSISFRPTIFVSHGSVYAAQISWLLNKPHLSLEDSGNMEQIRLYLPFTKLILTPIILNKNFGKKQVNHNSYHELAYLHPRYFKPDEKVKSELGLKSNQKYCIIRLVSWNATHDLEQKGITPSFLNELIKLLSKSYTIFISSESKLSASLKKYEFPISPEKMHSVLYYADLYIGEGATMAAEAGILGTPSIYINTIERCYCEDLENFGLVHNYRSSEGVIEKILELQTSKKSVREKREALFTEKEDLTEIILRQIYNLNNSSYK